jgi:hypothetical protein
MKEAEFVKGLSDMHRQGKETVRPALSSTAIEMNPEIKKK